MWINQLVKKLKDGTYTANGKTRCINLRFEGLWDTVPHLGARNEREANYDFGIPDAVKFVAHANALNEYRGTVDNFHFRSILASPSSASSATRIEKGFLGAHSDVGGGYGTGDLSNVALMWMINQANGQGIKFLKDVIQAKQWNAINNPVLHDSSTNLFNGAPDGGPAASSVDRDVIYTNGTKVKERKAISGTMSYTDTVEFITYKANPLTSDHISGTVDGRAYAAWP